jgi:hypothetical protein
MMTPRSFTILCAVTVLVSVAAIAVNEDSSVIPGSGDLLFPGLLSDINEVEKIKGSSADEQFTLTRGPEGWIVPDRFGYPANADKVHKLLVGAAGLKRVEPKTKKAALYPKLGLEDVSYESSRAVSFSFEAADDSTLASLIVGNSAPAKGDPEASAIYVRLPGDPQSWLVEGKLPKDGTLLDWLDRKVLDIGRKRSREVRVRHEDGEVVVVSKNTPADKDFSLADVPSGKEIDAQWSVNDIGRALADLDLRDVRPRGAIAADVRPVLSVTMRTFDGLRVVMDVFKDDKESLGVLKASFEAVDQSPVGQISDPASADGSKAPPRLLAPEEVRAEAAKLNARWRNWVYVLPDFKFDHLAKKQADLVKDETQEAQQAGG